MHAVQHLIGGQWRQPSGEHYRTSISPLGEERGAWRVTDATGAELDHMLHSAKEAQVVWYEKLTVKDRAASFLDAAAALREATDQIASLLTSETGKTLAESRGEIGNAVKFLEYYSGSMLRPQGHSFNHQRSDTAVISSREPLGVVLGIAPWNFPVNLSLMKLSAALATGNAFVLKPSFQTAATTQAYVAAIAEYFPAGLISVVQGGAAVVQQAIADHRISAVTFTGSTSVGRTVIQHCGTRGIPCLAEMGGNNAVVLGRSGDLSMALDAAMEGAFRMSGQKCTASGLLLVEESRIREVEERIRHMLPILEEKYRVGDPFDAGTVIGAMITADDAVRVESLVASAVRSGAERLRIGEAPTGGAYLVPQILFGVAEDMQVFTEETFGPILCVMPYQSIDEAVDSLNGLGTGLVASIFSHDLAEVFKFSERVQSGTVLANQPTTGLDFNVPFQGWNQSGFGGAEQSDEALHFYSRTKTLYVSW